jgi:hypothetical protein
MENFKLNSSMKFYDVDFDKVKSLEDIVAILKCLQVVVTINHGVIPDNLKELFEKGFLKERGEQKEYIKDKDNLNTENGI